MVSTVLVRCFVGGWGDEFGAVAEVRSSEGGVWSGLDEECPGDAEVVRSPEQSCEGWRRCEG